VSGPGLINVYPPLAPVAALRPRGRAFPFGEPGLRLTHLGRGAVWLALRALGLGPGARVAMPAYHCGSEVEAARLAGLEIDFYRVDSELRVDEDDLARAAAGTDAVYAISHFGFPIPAAPAGAPVIEDAAHGLFSTAGGAPLGSRGDAAVFCPRKSLGVPDGGALLVPDARARARVDAWLEGRPRARGLARSTASLAAARAALSRIGPLRATATRLIAGTSRTDAAARAGTLTETVIGEWDLEVADMETAAAPPARLTAALAPRSNPDLIRARRRANYARLLDEFGERCPEPYRELPDGVCPLYLPVRAADRPAATAKLIEHGVRALEVWPVPHPLLDRERFSELEPARRELLALPVHQSLEPRHLDAVVRAAKTALTG